MSRGKLRPVLGLGGALVILDQVTKWWVRETIPLGASLPVLPAVLDLTHVRNPGGAFSLFAGSAAAWRLPFFLAATAVAVAALGYFILRTPPADRGGLLALTAVLAGAVGNAIDRLTTGRVTDFIDVHWRSYHWPAFNVADSCITLGVAFLLWRSFRPRAAAARRPRPAGGEGVE